MDDGDTNYNSFDRNDLQRLGKEAGKFVCRRTRGVHPDYGIVKIDQNIEKILGGLKRHAVTQTPVKDAQLMPGRKSW